MVAERQTDVSIEGAASAARHLLHDRSAFVIFERIELRRRPSRPIQSSWKVILGSWPFQSWLFDAFLLTLECQLSPTPDMASSEEWA